MKRFVFYCVLFLLFSCNEKITTHTLAGEALGTTYSVKYISSKPLQVQSKIDSLISVVNKSLSTYIPTSDISKINKGDTSIVVDDLFIEVFDKSERIYKETDGVFDPTIGILVNAWGFGPEKPTDNLTDEKINELLMLVGFDKVKIVNNKVSKDDLRIYFDFNAIAKGYLVDLVGRMFEQNDITNYLVEIGGEIRARGKNESDHYWKIAIESPNTDGSRSFASFVELQDESMATSGNYRKFRISEDGKKYVHTINTKTGYATESNLLSASVIGKTDCADVDGYATAFMAMGLENTLAFLENHPELKSVLIYADNKGELVTYKSPGLE